MAARKTPSKGRKSDRIVRDALLISLKEECAGADGKPTKKLRRMADKLVEIALEGDVQAIKEVADRVEGKPTQLHGEDPDFPMSFVRKAYEIPDDVAPKLPLNGNGKANGHDGAPDH